jgi:hypothetical protein
MRCTKRTKTKKHSRKQRRSRDRRRHRQGPGRHRRVRSRSYSRSCSIHVRSRRHSPTRRRRRGRKKIRSRNRSRSRSSSGRRHKCKTPATAGDGCDVAVDSPRGSHRAKGRAANTTTASISREPNVFHLHQHDLHCPALTAGSSSEGHDSHGQQAPAQVPLSRQDQEEAEAVAEVVAVFLEHNWQDLPVPMWVEVDWRLAPSEEAIGRHATCCNSVVCIHLARCQD